MSTLINDLRDLIKQFDETTTMEPPVGSATEVFLDGNFCPIGMSTCDPSQGKCPDEHMNPIIYAKNGLRCYTNEAIAHMTPEDTKKSVDGIRALVAEVAKMEARMREVGKIRSPSLPAPSAPSAF